MTASSTHQPGPPMTAAITVSAPRTTSPASAKNLSTDPTSWTDDATDRALLAHSVFSDPSLPSSTHRAGAQTGRPSGPDGRDVGWSGVHNDGHDLDGCRRTARPAHAGGGAARAHRQPAGLAAAASDDPAPRRGPLRHHRRGGDLGR